MILGQGFISCFKNVDNSDFFYIYEEPSQFQKLIPGVRKLWIFKIVDISSKPDDDTNSRDTNTLSMIDK